MATPRSVLLSSNKSTTHLELWLGDEVINTYAKSTFNFCYDREMARARHGPLAFPSTAATHSCQKRTHAYLDKETTSYLFDQMPNVSKLVLLCAADEFTDNQINANLADLVMVVVKHWANTLVALRLCFQFVPNNLTELVAAINSMPVLQYLTLVVEEKGSDGEEVPIDLPILSKLEEFFFCYPTLTKQFIKSLAKHANAKLKQIGLYTNNGINEAQAMMLKPLVLAARVCTFPRYSDHLWAIN